MKERVFDVFAPVRTPWYIYIEKYLKPSDAKMDIETIYPYIPEISVDEEDEFEPITETNFYYEERTGDSCKAHPYVALEAFIYDVDQETALKMAREEFSKRFSNTMGVA